MIDSADALLAFIAGRTAGIEWTVFLSVAFLFAACVILWGIKLYSEDKLATSEANSRLSAKHFVITAVYFCAICCALLFAWKRAALPYLWLALAMLHLYMLLLMLLGVYKLNDPTFSEFYVRKNRNRSKPEVAVRIATNTIWLGLWIYSWRHLLW